MVEVSKKRRIGTKARENPPPEPSRPAQNHHQNPSNTASFGLLLTAANRHTHAGTKQGHGHRPTAEPPNQPTHARARADRQRC